MQNHKKRTKINKQKMTISMAARSSDEGVREAARNSSASCQRYLQIYWGGEKWLWWLPERIA